MFNVSDTSSFGTCQLILSGYELAIVLAPTIQLVDDFTIMVVLFKLKLIIGVIRLILLKV